MIRVRRLVVQGDSMLPGFRPGDRLLVVGPWAFRPGQVVALPDPRDGKMLLKRVHRLAGEYVDVRGDNAPFSTDSRHFGPVRRRDILGRVVLRYAPAARSGWWP